MRPGRRRVARRVTHLLVQVHLWLGLVLCVFMAVWFVSGFFMMYADYTTQVDDEVRLAAMTPLLPDAGWVSVEEAARAAGIAPLEVQGAAAPAARSHRCGACSPGQAVDDGGRAYGPTHCARLSSRAGGCCRPAVPTHGARTSE
ncbi:MAG: hypothetical protein U0163_10960 [Gemmatimonadaceae bacterium]